MTIQKIHYEQLFPTGVYANQRLRVEATLDESDTLEISERYKTLKDIVEKAFIELNPQIKWDVTNPLQPIPETQIQKSNDQRRIESMIKDMETVTDLKVLESYEFLAKKYPEIKQAYENKLNQLQK